MRANGNIEALLSLDSAFILKVVVTNSFQTAHQLKSVIN